MGPLALKASFVGNTEQLGDRIIDLLGEIKPALTPPWVTGPIDLDNVTMETSEVSGIYVF